MPTTVSQDELLRRLGVTRVALIDFARRHRLAEFSIFGSVLRDDFSDTSDVDILFEPAAGEAMNIERYIAMTDELSAMFNRKVEVVRKSLVTNPFRRANILRSREVIHAA